MSWAEQVIITLAVLQAEQIRAIFVPAVGLFVRLAWQERWKMNFLEARVIHLFSDDSLDIAKRDVTQWQPRINTRGDSADITGAYQETVAGYLSIGGIVAKRAQ